MWTSRKINLVVMCLCVVWPLSVIFGCGRPQASPGNRALTASLRTAVNTRNAQWLEKNAQILEQRRAAGQMANAEYEEFQSIINMARAGQWEKAEREVIAFQKAQRPTEEEMNKVSRQRS
mgnify:CR=1 FL=1